jgi:hypothetical protein
MRKRLIAVLLALGGGLLLAGMPAHAQGQLAGFNANALSGGNTPLGTGDWHVEVQQAAAGSSTYEVLVQADTSNEPADYSLPPSSPSALADDVLVQFYSGASGSGSLLSIASTTTASDIAGWTSPAVPLGTTEVWWNNNAKAPTGNLDATGTIYDIGSVTLAHGDSPADSVNVLVANNAYWSGTGNFGPSSNPNDQVFTPEASSMALLLPCLGPLGFVLRRRIVRK